MDGLFPILEALLAFALTMLLLATAVSAVVGAVLRLMRSRARNLRKTVDAFYRNEVVPALARVGITSVGGRGASAEESRRLFLKEMTLAPNTVATSPERRDALPELVEPGWLPALLVWKDLARGVDTLPADEFRTRFRGSTVGRELLPQAPALLTVPAPANTPAEEAYLDEAARRFQAYLAAAAESLTRRTRPWHVVASLVLVLALRVDAIEVVKSYLRSPEIVAKVIEIGLPKMAPGAAAPESTQDAGVSAEAGQFEAQLALLKSGVSQLELAKVALDGAAQADLDRLLTGAKATVAAAEAFGASARQEFGRTRNEVLWLVDGLPVGSDGYPFCAVGTPDPRCQAARTGNPPQWLVAASELIQPVLPAEALPPAPTGRWLLGWLLTSLMVGLGTSVWMEVVNRMLSLRDSVRNTARPG